MPKERDLKMEKYSISGNRYRELKYFCRQYREKQSRLREISCTAAQRETLQKDVSLVEQSAAEANAGLAAYILRNVADGVAYERLGVPVGRRQFYEVRRKFFFILSAKKG